MDYGLYAQNSDRFAELSKKIIEAKSAQDVFILLQELAGLYFKENKYNECVQYLKSISSRRREFQPVLNYYTGLTRYNQLRYLEEAQNWDEYFKEGNNYREDLVGSLDKVINARPDPQDSLSVYARLVIWKFHAEQNDGSKDQALNDLVDSVLSYAKQAKDLLPVKSAAEELSAKGHASDARRIYKAYLERINTSQISEADLEALALSFYNEGNLDLAQGVYDAYIEKAALSLPPEKLIPILTKIARDFAYKDEGRFDPQYAEKLFQKIGESGVKNAFDEELIYLRAINLEKSKEYKKAKEIYLGYLQLYPKGIHAERVRFKLGMIFTYILADENAGVGFFKECAQPLLAESQDVAPEGDKAADSRKGKVSPEAVSSLYQLGLLNQWQEDLTKAKEYYGKLLTKVTKEDFADTWTLAVQRLKEIEEARPLDYNLKTFLDVSLKEENAHLDMTKVSLVSHPGISRQQETIKVTSVAFPAESGCLRTEQQFLWSGHLGEAASAEDKDAFQTSYKQAGTKEINLVVVSPGGVIDRSIDFVDID